MPFNKMKKRLVYQCTVCSNLFSYRNTCFTHIIFAHFLKLPQTGDKVSIKYLIVYVNWKIIKFYFFFNYHK